MPRKSYLFLASGMSILSLITYNSPALAETFQSAAADSERIVTPQVISNASNFTTPKLSQVDSATQTFAQTTSIVTAEDPFPLVNQLSDVKSTDWAYEALQSLIEHYGCIVGYPKQTYRGSQSLTRHEFAAGLNACLNQIERLIASSETVAREDIETLQRLMQEFEAELATLGARTNNLEGRVAFLEDNQFSTTTKLTGQVIFATNVGGFSSERIIDSTGVEIADEDPNITFLYRVSLDLNTSFRGTDLLKIRLETGSNGGNDNAAGFLEPNFGSVLDFSVKPPTEQILIGRLYYTFKPLQDLKVSLGPAIVATDYIDRNSYANLSFKDFTTQALINNYLLFPIFGAGAGGFVEWNPGEGPFTVRAIYMAADASNPSSDNQRDVGPVTTLINLLYPDGGGNRGLFGDPYQGIVEMEYIFNDTLAVRLQYGGGNIFDGRFDVLGVNFEWSLSPKLAVFGRYGYSDYSETAFGDINPNYWMAGVAFPDLFKPGALAGIAASQPFIDSAVGNATQTNVEAFYNFPLRDNIEITPIVQIITNPANQDSNGTIVTGTLRTVFSF